MRDIKFRGKRIDDGEWVYGHLFYGKNKVGQDEAFIVSENYNCYGRIIDLDTCSSWEVNPNTIGQYTDLKDKDGVEIYEGDIVKNKDGIDIVKFHDGCFLVVNQFDEHFENEELLFDYMPIELEVIGNIYDNPTLLKGE